MNDPLLGIVGIAGTILAAAIGFVLGQRRERARQASKAVMLNQVREWLAAVEKSSVVLADTLSSAALGPDTPTTYALDERRKPTQFVIARTNEVLGILDSGSLDTRRSRARVADLRRLIIELDSQVKYRLLPLDHELRDRAAKGQLTQAFAAEVGQFKHGMDKKVQAAYSDVATIRTALR